jgi:hypothetical protein
LRTLLPQSQGQLAKISEDKSFTDKKICDGVAVFCLAIGGSIALNYESMARKHGFPIGSAFIGATKITIFVFASTGVSVIFSLGYGKWWYAVLVFFAGMSIKRLSDRQKYEVKIDSVSGELFQIKAQTGYCKHYKNVFRKHNQFLKITFNTLAY